MELYYFARRIFFNTLKACCVRPLKRGMVFRGEILSGILKLINNSWRHKPTRVPHLGQVDD